MAVSAFHEFDSREELANSLAGVVAERLTPKMELGEFGSIALSGGSTPKLFLQKLGAQLGDAKELIYFALVDERYVPADDERSNERMLREMLGLQEHPASEFLSLYVNGLSPEDAATFANTRLTDDEELPFNVVTLGMGLDGHTASFFPGGDQLQNAVNPNSEVLFETIRAPGAEEPRITLTLPAIVSAHLLVLHIEGQEKRDVYEKALEDGAADELPVRHVLRHPNAKVEVYWAP